MTKRSRKPTPITSALARADVRLTLRSLSSAPRGPVSFSAHGRTDRELWTALLSETLKAMGYGSDMVVYFLADLINVQSIEMRQLLGNAIVYGAGLQVIEHSGMSCPDCGASARDGEELTHRRIVRSKTIRTASDGIDHLVRQMRVVGPDYEPRSGETIEECEGEPVNQVVFERALVEPLPMVKRQERAGGPRIPGLWLPGRGEEPN